MENPLRSEAGMFRVLTWCLVIAAVVVVGVLLARAL